MSRNDVTALCWLAGVGLLFVVPLLGLILLTVAFCRSRPRWQGSGTSHGTARFCTWAEAAKAGLLADDGLVLGRADRLLNRKERRALAKLLRLRAFTHLATFAPTGRGKGISVIIPNLLMYGGSVVVTDPKGENFKLTAAYRQRRFGQRILRLDVTQPGGDCLNPLDFIDARADDFLEQCRELAVMLVKREPNETQPYWNDMAELFISAIIAFVCSLERNPAERNLITVRQILLSRERLTGAIGLMQQIQDFGGVLSRLGHLLAWPVDRELASIMGTVQSHTAFLDSTAVARSVMRTSFNPRILRTPQGASLFLCFPHDQLKALAPLNRMWVGTLLKILTKGTPTESHKVLFMLDEVAHLGNLPSLSEDAVTMYRGMGIRLWFFWQSLGQVKEHYGEHAGTYLDNIDTKQYFGTNNVDSAKAISEHIGDTTILVESLNETESRNVPDQVHFQPHQPGSTTIGRSLTYSEQGRPLLRPDEVIRMDEDVCLITHRNLPVIASTLVKYYADAEFADYRRMEQDQRSLAVAGSRPKLPALPGVVRPVATFAVRFVKGAAALTLLGVILMLADPKSELSQAIQRAGNGSVSGKTAQKPKPPVKPMRPVLVPIDKDNYLLIPGEQYNQYKAEHPNAQPLRSLPPASQPKRPQPLPRRPLPRRSVPSIPANRDPGTLATVATAAGPVPRVSTPGVDTHLCFDPKWCPDPLNCPQLRQRIRLAEPRSAERTPPYRSYPGFPY